MTNKIILLDSWISIGRVGAWWDVIICFQVASASLESIVIAACGQFSYFSTKTYVMGTQKNCLIETVLLSTQNIC